MKINLRIPHCYLFIVVLCMAQGNWGFSMNNKSTTKSEKQPNVIIVMTDDQGYGELSFHGNPVLKTPYLDQLAKQSLRFTNFHVAPMCAPTRGQLMTGLDAARNGTINVSSGRELLNPELSTMANYFDDNGYQTGIFGKWHLGPNYPYRPQDRGFTESVWFPSSHIGAVSDYWGNDYFDDTYIHNGVLEAYKGYCTDVFFEEAMSFMKNSVANEKPFFTYIPTNTPHGPLISKEEDAKALAKAFEASPLANLDQKTKDRLIQYLGMVRNIDTNMGRLLDFLKANDLEKNTIVIFMTDNGSTHGPLYYNAGMRGMKTQFWDGGHRVPLFVRWPKGKLAKPSEINGLTQAQDILPTLIDLCQLEVKAPTDFDGMSLAPILRGEDTVPEDRMFVINYSRMPSGFNYPSPYGQSIMKKEEAGVLWKAWRLLESRELYNLDTDPKQQTNIISQYPEVVQKMQNHLDSWWDAVKEDVNTPNRIIIGNEQENPQMLTACDWLDVFVDQQGQIRRGIRKTGYWLLEVDQAGEYEFELRRWPKEIDVPLMGRPSEKSTALPITSASVYANGVNHRTIAEKEAYGFEGLVKQVVQGDTSVTFTMDLKAGPTALHTWFNDKQNQAICSAYYVYVRRK